MLGQRMDAKMLLGDFDYAAFFPGSSNLKKLSESVAANQRATEGEIATPLFSDFPDQWFQESKIQWRSSHTRNVVSILDSSLKPAFKNTQIAEITKADILAARTKMAKRRGRGRGASGLMAPKTINSHLTILRMIMAEASERFEFDNPYRNIKPLKLQKVHFR